jgi:hypothetical protein
MDSLFTQAMENYTEFLNFINKQDCNEIKFFKTIHSTKKSILYIKLQNTQLFQFFFDCENNSVIKTNFHIKKLPNDFNELYIIGELTLDMHQNKIFLIEDIWCRDYMNMNINISSIETRLSILSNIVENISTSTIDPFLIQIKVIYPYELQMIDVFFKTILISMNTSMDGIVLMNSFGCNIEFIECKNRVELDYSVLEQFIENIPNIFIVNHVEDLNDSLSMNTCIEYKHKDEKVFYSVKDSHLPDIYYLFESELDYQENFVKKKKNIAMIPSLLLSEYMSIKNNYFYQKYFYHEYHQKWIPLITFP